MIEYLHKEQILEGNKTNKVDFPWDFLYNNILYEKGNLKNRWQVFENNIFSKKIWKL